MKKIIIFSLSLFMYSFAIHVQSIGICKVKETKDALEYSFVFPIENISKIHTSLKDYNNSLKDLISLQNVISKNIEISINNQKVDLQYDTTITEDKFITLKYTTPFNKQIASISIENKGLSFMNRHHTSFDFWLYLQDKKRLFKLNAQHKTIKATY